VARGSLDAAAAYFIWGALFLIFTPWTLLTVPAGIVVSLSALLFWLPSRAEAFGELLEAACDLASRSPISATPMASANGPVSGRLTTPRA
jgi:hypothetical protein